MQGLPQFDAGVSGEIRATPDDHLNRERINSDNLTGKPLLNIGPQNFTVKIPNPDTGIYQLYQVYNDSLIELPPVTLSSAVPDYVDVNDKQYINTRVASVSKGTLNVAIGNDNAAPDASINRCDAKRL